MQNAKFKITIQNLKIISNKKIKNKYYKLLLKGPKIAREARLGQFVHIRVSDGCEPLLRRPFSIHRVSSPVIEILYEVVGRGTKILSEKKPGEYLDILGPLGNGFSLTPNTYDLKPILVAGGIGVAPLIFLAEKLAEIKKSLPAGRQEKSKIKNIVLIGGRTKKDILCEEEFKRLGYDVRISTDDGSKDFKGKVTDLLRHLLSTLNCQLSTIYACGPKPMLKEISQISKKYKIPTQVSLEEHMGCGLGACLGCAVKTKNGYRRVCKDGPIFNTDEISWEN